MSILQQTEAKIRKAYRDLEDEISDTVMEHCKRYLEAEKRNKKRVEQGTMTEAEFQQWQEKELLYSQWSKDMMDDLADRIDTVNEACYQEVEKAKDDAYSEGAIAGLTMLAGALKGRPAPSKEVAKSLKEMGITFTVTGKGTGRPATVGNTRLVKGMYDKKMMLRLRLTAPSLLPAPSDATLRTIQREGLKRWNRRRINSVVLRGIRKGQSVPKIAKGLRTVANMDRAQSVRNARTMLTNARNRAVYQRGLEASKHFDLVTKTWETAQDARVRPRHRDMHGETVDLLDLFSNDLRYPADEDGEPAEVYNCRCTMILDLGDSGATEREAEEAIGL